MHNVETTEALVWAAEQAEAPVFLQVGRAIVPHMGVRKAYEMTKRVAEESDADIMIQIASNPENLEAVGTLVDEHADLEKRLSQPETHADARLAKRLNQRYAELVEQYADDADVNAALFSAADLTITGSGSLAVTGNGNDGIGKPEALKHEFAGTRRDASPMNTAWCTRPWLVK